MMISNYLKVAIRNILKHKFYSAINIFGMTVGITCCLLLSLYIFDELSYDRFHADADRIYQVGLHGKIGGQDIRTANTCPPMAAALVTDFPEVESSVRLAPAFGQASFKYDDKVFTEERIFFTDSNFFQFFTFKLKEGDPLTALKGPNKVVLTENLARKYFGKEPALGKLMVIGGDNRTYTVTGVAENPPANNHFRFNGLLSAESSDRLKQPVWLNNFMYTYLKLRTNANVSQVESKFDGMVEKYIGPELERFVGITVKQMRESGGAYGYFTTKITDIHLHSTTRDGIEAGGSVLYIYFFGGIGVFIIVIACINFMNLSTARSAGRAKEVGLRKTLGSLRSQMISQFLSESFIYSFLAVLFSVALCYLALPAFNALAGKELGFALLMQPFFIISLVVLVVFVALIAGSYPAFYLTSFSPVEVLKGKVRAGLKSKGIRSFLVVFQFALSIFLIIFTVIVYQQITFMQTKNLGLDKNNVLIIESTRRLGNNKQAFRNALDQEKSIMKVSYTNNTFPGVNNTTVFRSAASDQDHIMGQYFADYDHMDVIRFELKEGRYFSKDFPSDSSAIILNEAAVREFGLEKPLESEILSPEDGGGNFKRLKVIGVIKNFNFESFRDEVRPLSIRLTNDANNLMIRYEGNPSEVVATVEKLWKQYASNEPLDYNFMDQNFDELFRAEQRMSKVFTLFSGLAILIASLGLFALAAFTAEQRTKEIGIRKSMGASVTNLTLLLSKEFTRLVLIAFLPACAVGWYVAENWLEGFAYRIDIHPLVFVISGLIAIVIAWITVSYQSIKAAMANPVNSLRYE